MYPLKQNAFEDVNAIFLRCSTEIEKQAEQMFASHPVRSLVSIRLWNARMKSMFLFQLRDSGLLMPAKTAEHDTVKKESV